MFVEKSFLILILLLSFSCLANENLVVESNGYAVDHFYKNRAVSNSDVEMDFDFSELDYSGLNAGTGFTRITRLVDDTIIFEGVTPEFSKFHISNGGEIIGFSGSDFHIEPNLIIFNNKGKVVFSGFGDLFIDQYHENNVIDFSVYKTSLSGNNQKENISEDLRGEKIIINCGGFQWLDSVKSVVTNTKDEVLGFWFNVGNKVKYFDLITHNKILSENKKALSKRLIPLSSIECKSPQTKTFFDGVNFSTWCETKSHKRIGKFSRWVKVDESELEYMLEDVTDGISNVTFSGNYILGIEGFYGLDGRENTWYGQYATWSYSCVFVANKIHGVCEEFDEGRKEMSTQYVAGKAQGLEIEFYLDGNVRNKKNRSGGVLHGASVEYHHNGEISYSTNYLNGYEHGEACSYSNSGVLKICRKYLYGNVVTKDKSQDILLNL